MTSLTKNLHPQAKIFFRVQTRRLAAFFDASTRSVTRTGADKFLCKATCVLVLFFRKSPISARHQSVNTFAAVIRYICTLSTCISCCFHATLQLHNSPGDQGREQFKTLKDAASLLVCIENYFNVLGFRFSVGDVIGWKGFRPF